MVPMEFLRTKKDYCGDEAEEFAALPHGASLEEFVHESTLYLLRHKVEILYNTWSCSGTGPITSLGSQLGSKLWWASSQLSWRLIGDEPRPSTNPVLHHPQWSVLEPRWHRPAYPLLVAGWRP